MTIKNLSMKKIIKKFIPAFAIKKLIDIRNQYSDYAYALKSYSQEGEDMILRRIFDMQSIGFYVDVGAHHPKRFSNTYYFYKQGWKGINIDAMPGSMKLFNKIRPRDVNIEKPISNTKEMLKYYMFNDSALNGFSKKLSESMDGLRSYRVIGTKDIKTVTLTDVLDTYLPKKQNIDFLSIDVEGLDFNVLKSNNFEKYRPKVILIESLGGYAFLEVAHDEISIFLKELDYSIYAKAVNTLFYIDNTCPI